MSSYDLLILGGGIGGSALATVMARAGKAVLLLEASEVYEDKVRGEWIAPWGVVEARRIGVYGVLMAAGGHHVTRHVTYDESIDPKAAEVFTIPLGAFAEGVPGPLCLRHPVHCQALFDAAKVAGAEALKGVNVLEVAAGDAPRVVFEVAGERREASGRLLIGADGRASMVREAVGIALHQDKPHHWFAGLLVDGVGGWDAELEAIGTEGDFGFLVFPQGGGRARIYGGYALDQAQRFRGPEGPRKFLDAFAIASSPNNRHIVAGDPAGPLFSYFNNDSWTDEPYAEGAVLIGDAAGWNDPIIGLGLSITYRDVRIVSELLQGADDWAALSFASYGEERAERMRRLRFTAALQATIDMEFDESAKARRKRIFERSAADPSVRGYAAAVLAGPEALPPDFFTDAYRDRVLNG